MPVAEDFRTWVRCPPPPPTQPIRTAFRGLDEVEDLEGGLGLVVSFPDLRHYRDQSDRAQQPAQQEGRTCCIGFEKRLERAHPFGNPLHRRGLEERLRRCFVSSELGSQGSRLLLGGAESFPESSCAFSLSPELDVVADSPLLGRQPGTLSLDLFGEVRVRLA